MNSICEIMEIKNEIDFYPAIAYSNITDEEVDNALEALINKIADDYFKAINYGFDNGYAIEKRCYRQNRSEIKIFPEQKKMCEKDIKNGRFYYLNKVSLKKLENKDSFDHLLQQLSKIIFELGYKDTETGEFDIRFEKGHMDLSESTANRWHFDGFKTSISVCWSNKENWTTKILNLDSPEDTIQLKKKLNGLSRLSKKYDDRINALVDLNYAESAKFGFLHDVTKICHRSPNISSEREVNEYRLFIRYNEF